MNFSDTTLTLIVLCLAQIATIVLAVLNKLDADRAYRIAMDTHVLVNSNMGRVLRLNAVVTRKLADVTKRPDDIEAATLAQDILQEHDARQYRVDND